jgi:hypothetical protein
MQEHVAASETRKNLRLPCPGGALCHLLRRLIGRRNVSRLGCLTGGSGDRYRFWQPLAAPDPRKGVKYLARMVEKKRARRAGTTTGSVVKLVGAAT